MITMPGKNIVESNFCSGENFLLPPVSCHPHPPPSVCPCGISRKRIRRKPEKIPDSEKKIVTNLVLLINVRD